MTIYEAYADLNHRADALIRQTRDMARAGATSEQMRPLALEANALRDQARALLQGGTK